MPTNAEQAIEIWKRLEGKAEGTGEWLKVEQNRINQFADATGDHQFIHVDPEKAAQLSPYKVTIAHGFLTLSLCVPMLYELLEASETTVNYGVNRVRFPAAVPSGGRIRGHAKVVSIEEIPLGRRGTIEVTVECEGIEKPVCVAELVVLRLSDHE
jgi:acyl dehydratase